MRRILSSAAVLAALLLPAAARAQDKELGLDAGLNFGFSPSTTSIEIPQTSVRAGFYIDKRLSFEPAIGLSYFSVGGASVTSFSGDLGVLYHFSADRTKQQFYLRPLVAIRSLSGSGSSDSQFGLGIGAGLKFPFEKNVVWRTEGTLRKLFQSGNLAGNTSLSLNFGFSVYVD